MAAFHITTVSAEDTMKQAQEIGRLARAGDVITLSGDLGTGKTHFAKGLAHGLGVTGNVNSPTYTIMKEYKGRFPFYHMDVYRLEEESEELGLEEYIEGDGVTLIEWPERIESWLDAPGRLQIKIEYAGDDKRIIHFSADSGSWLNWIEERKAE
jgi:tRNA threonylcarbamoyladenosine biosynthesis protein TsaE